MSEVSSSQIIERFKTLQDSICTQLETLESKSVFQQDLWDRPEGGGGRTRIIQGDVIEKGGVNFSAVHGAMPERIASALGLPANNFLATGVSIVIHPVHPWVPIIHMNVRYFETNTGHWWFGGGIDLTPHIIVAEDAQYFHKQLKAACDQLSPSAYQEYKQWADDYFYIPHRQETRGIGGIFFDRLNDKSGHTKKACWDYVIEVGETFAPTYLELVHRNLKKHAEDAHSNWQKLRRGRYVEFNLVYDKGTKFGLQTNGRIESILMSLPPEVHYRYNYSPQYDFEKYTQSLLKKDIDWINYTADSAQES